MWKSFLVGVAVARTLRARAAGDTRIAHGGEGRFNGGTPLPAAQSCVSEITSENLLPVQAIKAPAGVVVRAFLAWANEVKPDEIAGQEWVRWDRMYDLCCEYVDFSGFQEISPMAFCKAMTSAGVERKMVRLQPGDRGYTKAAATVERPRIAVYRISEAA